VSYNKQRLHKVGYFSDLLSHNEEVSDSIRPPREQIERRQLAKYIAEVPPQLPVKRLPAALGNEHNMISALPLAAA
jgi:hypothetical protein